MNEVAPSVARVNWATLGLALALCIPSTAVVQRYLRNVGLLAYLIVATAALILFVRRRDAFGRLAARLSPRGAFWLAALTFAVILAAFLFIYPHNNTGIVRGGSDSDDALNIAVTELVLGFASFGVFFLFFGAVPSWKALYPAVRSEQAIVPAEERSRQGEG